MSLSIMAEAGDSLEKYWSATVISASIQSFTKVVLNTRLAEAILQDSDLGGDVVPGHFKIETAKPSGLGAIASRSPDVLL
jgi:hypothetical protein